MDMNAGAWVPKEGSKLLTRDVKRLQGVNANLCRVIDDARDAFSFFVVEGLRTYERQVQLFREKKTMTLNSKHMLGLAVDIAPWDDIDEDSVVDANEVDWNDREAFRDMANVVFLAAITLQVPIKWGGNFRTAAGKPWFDGPHFEIA